MATGSVKWTGENKYISLATSGTLTWSTSEWASTIATIPKYSKMNSVTLTINNYTGTANASCVYKVGSSQVASITIRSVQDRSYSLLKYTNSNNSSAGYINGNITATIQSSSSWLAQAFYTNRIDIVWNFTYPTYTINASAQMGGTVSGNIGTFDVKTTNQTKTITATAQPGYRFIGWVDANGNTVSTNASYSITVSHNTISANATTLSLTAKFEKILISSLDIVHQSLNIKLSDTIQPIYDYINVLYQNKADCGIINGTCRIQPNSLVLQSTGQDCYVNSYWTQSPVDAIKKYLFTVNSGQTYTYAFNAKMANDKISSELNGTSVQIFVFYYDNNYNYISHDASSSLTSQENFCTWTTPSNAAYASIRVDNNEPGYEVWYTNIFVYEGRVKSLYNKAYLGQIIEPKETEERVEWSSSDSNVASVNKDTGLITANGIGIAIITGTSTDSGLSINGTITIIQDAEGPKAYLGTIPVKIYFGNDLITNYHFFLS